MTEIYLHFLFAHYGLYGNAPVPGRADGAALNTIVSERANFRDHSAQYRIECGPLSSHVTVWTTVEAPLFPVWFPESSMSVPMLAFYVQPHRCFASHKNPAENRRLHLAYHL